QKMGVEVYGVSTDSHFVHKAWHESSEEVGKVNYPMIGDSNGDLTRNFQNMREGVGQADRATFLVDPQGIIQYIEQTAEGIGRDASELVRKIKAAQYVAEHPGEVCPARWEAGQATLTPGIDLVGKSSPLAFRSFKRLKLAAANAKGGRAHCPPALSFTLRRTPRGTQKAFINHCQNRSA